MRMLILSIFLITTQIGHVQAKAIDSDMAERYYQDCISKDRPQNLSEEGQDKLCACTASKMIESMDTNDIAALSSQDQTEARAAINHMIINVYAPCMEYPTRDYYFYTCASNPKTSIITKDPTKLCNCMSDKISKYMAKNGKDVFEDILTRTPNIIDPMSALESDPEFQNYTKQQATSCLF